MNDDAATTGDTPDSAADQLAAEIRRRRRTAKLSQRELAHRSGYTREYVSTAERYGANLPSRDLVRALDRALDAEGSLLALRERAKAEQLALREDVLDGHLCDRSWVISSGVYDRQEKLRTDASGLPVARVDLADRASVAVGGSDVQMFIDAHKHYERMYRHSGGLPAGMRLESFLNEYAAPLLAGSYSDSIGRQLRRAVGALVALAGIYSYDCEHHGAAQRYFDHALRLAKSSGDLRFGGYVYALMVNQALALGDFRQAVDHTEAAMGYAADHMSPALMADLRVMQAKAYAQMGEPQLTYSAIAEAESSAERIRREVEPSETSYVQPGLIEVKLGEALISLGDLNSAYRYAQESLKTEDHPRGRVNRLASMATLRLKSGDVEQASSLAIEMIYCARGMESRRLHSRFRELRIALNNSRTNITAEAVERIDRMLRIFPW